MEINDLIRPEWIRLDMEGESREEVIRALAGILDRSGILSDKEQYLADVFEREKMGSTAIGFDVAIPHGKSRGVKEPAVAFARLTRPHPLGTGEGRTGAVDLFDRRSERKGRKRTLADSGCPVPKADRRIVPPAAFGDFFPRRSDSVIAKRIATP